MHDLNGCLSSEGCVFQLTAQDTMWEEHHAHLIDEWLYRVTHLSETLGLTPPKLKVDAYEYMRLRDSFDELVWGRPLDWLLYACNGFHRDSITIYLHHPRPSTALSVSMDDWLEWSFVVAFCDELAGSLVFESRDDRDHVAYDVVMCTY